jgi:hypothetical protein
VIGREAKFLRTLRSKDPTKNEQLPSTTNIAVKIPKIFK